MHKHLKALWSRAGVGACLLVLGTAAQAGTNDIAAYSDGKHYDSMVETVAETKDWSIELGSGVLFSNVRTDDPHNNTTIVPIDLTAALAVDEVSLDHFAGGIFRGYTEFLFRASYDIVTEGQEHYLSGISVGPRYNFVQPGWRVIPFVEGTVGFMFTDSNPQPFPDGGQAGLGQDFNFMFGVAAGIRYDITECFFARLSCTFLHVSNAGLSEPEWQNKPIDALGPVLSFGYRF